MRYSDRSARRIKRYIKANVSRQCSWVCVFSAKARADVPWVGRDERCDVLRHRYSIPRRRKGNALAVARRYCGGVGIFSTKAGAAPRVCSNIGCCNVRYSDRSARRIKRYFVASASRQCSWVGVFSAEARANAPRVSCDKGGGAMCYCDSVRWNGAACLV